MLVGISIKTKHMYGSLNRCYYCSPLATTTRTSLYKTSTLLHLHPSHNTVRLISSKSTNLTGINSNIYEHYLNDLDIIPSECEKLYTTALRVLTNKDPYQKTSLTFNAAKEWKKRISNNQKKFGESGDWEKEFVDIELGMERKGTEGEDKYLMTETVSSSLGFGLTFHVPISRPDLPPLVSKKEAYSALSQVSKEVGILHNMAHIELNAVDLGWDLILRFRDQNLPIEFYTDWLNILVDEARHFGMLADRLKEVDSFYGVLPSHDGLLQEGKITSGDLKARLAVVQLVHEARGLDSGNRLVHRLQSIGSKESAKLVQIICEEEIDHVQKGVKWFKYLCEREDLVAIDTFHNFVHELCLPVFPPFNTAARDAAQMSEEWYLPVVTDFSKKKKKKKS